MAGNAKLFAFFAGFRRFEASHGELLNFAQMRAQPLELSRDVPI
jgi:hypothetical protein